MILRSTSFHQINAPTVTRRGKGELKGQSAHDAGARERISMKLNRREWMIGPAAGLAAMGLARPSWAEAAAEPSATGVPYVKKDQINGGKPIKLTYWEWVNTRAEYEKRWADEYHAMYPNVEIEVVMQPWEQYFQALATNIPSGQPARYHMHTSRASQFCDSKLMAPIPTDVADPDYLKKNCGGFAVGALSC